MPETHVVLETEVSPEVWSDAVRGILSFRTLTAGAATATGLCAGVAVLESGGWLGLHRHEPAETYYVLEGVGVLTIDGQQHALAPGAAAYIPGGAEHAVRNAGSGELRFFYVLAAGSFDDVVYDFVEERQNASDAV